MRRLVLPAFALAAVFALAACGSSGGTSGPTQGAASPPASQPTASEPAAEAACATSTEAATVEATIADFAFSPGTIEASVGDVVAWTNEDSAPHSVVVGSDCRTGNLQQGNTAALVFDAAGTYAYVCGIHPTMTGTVEVSE
jgi:plastocyanin